MPPMEMKALRPKVVLGVAAHPDDLDFSASAALAKFAKDGAKVYYLILTDGGKGSAELDASSEALQKTREAEQKAAVTAIGGIDAEFLGYPDGALMVSLEVKKDIVKVIRRLKPDVVVTMDPAVLYSAERGFINHPDHRAAGQAALDAVYPLARDHLSFPELFEAGYAPHKVATVLLSNTTDPNYVVDVSNTMENKYQALASHVSQIKDLERIKSWMEAMAVEQGKPHGFTYGEGFTRIDIRNM